VITTTNPATRETLERYAEHDGAEAERQVRMLVAAVKQLAGA
jgi:hypothetical protein